MTNRLRNFLRTMLLVMIGVGFSLLFTNRLSAQSGFFTFSYTGPTVIPAGPNCFAALSGNIPNPVVTATAPNAVVTMSMFDPVQSGYAFTDAWDAPTINLIVVWFVKDNQGHQANFFFTVSILDVTPPVFDLTGIDPVTVFNSIIQVPLPPMIPVTDNCPGMITRTFVESSRPDTCQAGSFTRTWRATDVAGNTAIFTQTININADMTLPVVTSSPVNGASPCSQLATAYPAWLATQFANFTATDDSGISAYTSNTPTFPPGCASTVTVTFRATDGCGLYVNRTAIFTTSDTDAPYVAVAPKDTIVYCTPAGIPSAKLAQWIHQRAYSVVRDSCTPDANLVHTMKVNGFVRDSAQITAAFIASLANGCGTQTVGGQMVGKVKGIVRVEFLTRDACNFTTSAGTADFALIDSMPPVVTGTNITEECGGADDNTALQAWINAKGNAAFTDECSTAAWTNFSWTTSDGQNGTGTFGTGPYPTVQGANCTWFADVTFRATDQCGNIGQKKLRFSIVDNTKPVFGALPTVRIYCPAVEPTTPVAPVSDNCDATSTVTFTKQTIAQGCTGNYNVLVNYTAIDDCGNSVTAQQIFEIRDTTGPVFSLVPANKTIRCDTFVLPPVPTLGMGINATDACSNVTSITTQTVSGQNPDPAVCGHYTYMITRTFTATDGCGNTSTATQIISVIDNLPPVLTGFADTTAVCETNPVLPVPTASDACNSPVTTPVKISDIITAGPCTDTYLRTLTWRAQDVCGNTGMFSQNVHVQDTIRPTLIGTPANITVECNAIPAAPAFSTFTATDNCADNVTIALVETAIRNPDITSCDHWTNYQIQRVWTATDNCGNTRAGTQIIQIRDTQGPELVLPATITLANDAGQCGTAVTIPAPLSLRDGCSSNISNVVLRDTVALISTDPLSVTMPGEVPVDTVVFQWASPNLPPTNPAVEFPTGTSPSLKIILENADSEMESERFSIIGENNTFLGLTAKTSVQCGNSTTILSLPVNQLNAWLADGQLTIKLGPNGSGANASNPLPSCVGRRALAVLSYHVADQEVPITLTYSLDGGPTLPYPPAGTAFLPPGNHTINYAATDCAGNTTTQSLAVVVQDTQAPNVAAPANLTAYVGAANCLATVVLPFPAMSDNCGFSGQINQASAVQTIQFESDANAGLVPKDQTLTIGALIPNAVTSGTLTIRHLGDNHDIGEFFKIYGEGNVFLDTTTYGTDTEECTTFHETTIPVTAAQINAWAATGNNAVIVAKANRDAANYVEFISNCNPLLPGNTDGESSIQAVLQYTYAIVNYEIFKGTTLIQSGLLSGGLTAATLPPGIYTIKYRVNDTSNNMGMTSYTLTVRDTVKPVAKCVSTTIYANPLGTQNYVVQPSEVNNNSVDNCSGTNLTYSVSPATFTCFQSPNTYPITLTVTDTAGNSASCSALVRVETAAPAPSYQAVCPGGLLQILANPPAAPGNNVYTYMWMGPNNFMSTAQNLDFPNASAINEGTYTVKITSITGCTSSASVTVTLLSLPNAPVLTANAMQLCTGDNIVLGTASYNGQNVQYNWYRGQPSSSTFLATTSDPTLTINQPPAGTYAYYVVVTGNNCISVNSNVVMVVVSPKPVAILETSQIAVCTGQPITLGCSSPTPGPGVSYSWSGPSMFTSSAQYPLVTNSATALQAGIYTLVVTVNGCNSTPVTVTVTVKASPAKPILTGNNQVCAGANVTMVSNVTNANEYRWNSSNTAAIIDTITLIGVNALTLYNVGLANNAFWTVQVMQSGCLSEVSDPFNLQVQAYPNINAPANIPICQVDTLFLSATSDINPLNWRWTGPGALNINTQNPVVPNALPGTYTVIGKTTFGCADTTSVSVTTVPAPTAIVTNNAPVCAPGNTNAMLQSVVASSNLPLMYSWVGPNMFTSSDPNPVIPNVKESNNGSYTLIVTDALGCSSAPQTTVLTTQNRPNTPLITPPAPICAGETIFLQVMNANEFNGMYVRYQWNKPGSGYEETTQPNLTIPGASFLNSGNYTVQVLIDSCLSPSSATVTVVVKPIPSPPTGLSNSPVCAGETLQFFVNNPLPTQTFFWKKIPGTFTSTQASPSIMNAQVTDSGNYYVAVKVNGCQSDFSDAPIVVVVKPKPKKPLALQVAPLCLQQPGTLTLSVSDTTGTGGASYQWVNEETGVPLALPSTALTYSTTNLAGTLQAGINKFYVVAILNGCISERSNTIEVKADIIPNSTAFAGLDFPACVLNNQPIILNAQQPTIGSGKWSQVGVSTTTIINPSNDSTAVTGGMAGTTYYFKWTISNGACLNYSSDTVKVTAVTAEKALAGFDIDTCFVRSLQLHATQGQTSVGSWSQPGTQTFPLKISIKTPSDPNTQVDSLPPNGGLFYFFWTLSDIGCGSSVDSVVVRVIGTEPYAGEDQFLCSNDSCTGLQALAINTNETGMWSSALGNLANITNPAGTNTTVCNLQPGPNIFYWITNNNMCGLRSRDTVVVNYNIFPTLLPDTLRLDFGQKTSIDALLNDILPPQYSITVVEPPMHAAVFENPDEGFYTYQPQISFSGTDRLTYEVCNLLCPAGESCVRQNVFFITGSADSCLIPTIITPNGDNVNDVFSISCLEGTDGAGSDVRIFNSWGDLVFHASPYKNTQPWAGEYKGQELPAGTYYFIVQLTPTSAMRTGFVIIQR